MTMKTLQALISFRKELHQYPEVSGNERETSQRIQKALRQINVPFQTFNNFGILVTFDSGKEGKSVLIRADFDALPIEEVNTFEHRSKNPGVSHKCGHDGHTTILLGLAEKLKDQPLENGVVHLIFQPSEENGEGAKGIIRDPEFGIHFDYAVALHNIPGYQKGQIICRKGSFTPAVKSLILEFHGKTAHAAQPEKGINPSLCVAKSLDRIQALNNNFPEKDDFFNVVPVHINVGSKSYGISPGYGELHLTFRSWQQMVMKLKVEEILSIAKEEAANEQVELSWRFVEEFDANLNDDYLVDVIKKTAEGFEYGYHNRDFPMRWGEDFGIFTQLSKGAMFGIGAGEDCPSLHNPDYDFPDEIIPVGISMFEGIIKRILEN